MKREETIAKAQSIATAAKLPKGARIVVVVTGEDGAWVGVGSNTSNADVEAILRSALYGADRRNQAVIDTELAL